MWDLQRSDISLATAYMHNIAAAEIINKRSIAEAQNDAKQEDKVYHRIDITSREYLETRAQAQQKGQSHYKFRIGNDGVPLRRGFMERRAETSTEEEEEDEILPTAALPIKRSAEVRRVLARR